MIVRNASVFLIVALSASVAAAQSDSSSPLHGGLEAGRHAVGFRTVTLHDASRPVLPARRPDGSAEPGDRARAITVHVWYPAQRTAAPALTVADYVTSADPTEQENRRQALRQFLGQFGPVSEEAWSGLLRTPLLARREANPAEGRFPLIIGQLRPFSTTITNEYLASHGYVVAMIASPAPDTRDAGRGLEAAVRDMEFTLPELRRERFVDPVRLATLGFSGAGFSQFLFAMRPPDVMAICDLESAIFDDRIGWPLHRGWGYDVAALRIPFLHTYSAPLSQLENRIADFEQMRYSTRYRYLVDAPGIHHWDFATEGMAASAVLRNRGGNGARLQQAFETTNRYVLAFYDAHVRGDPAALAFLTGQPTANGVPAGLVTMQVLPAVQPALSMTELRTRVDRDGVEAALQAFAEGRRRDPLASSSDAEPELNRIAYSVMGEGRSAEAIAIFRKVLELYPSSSNAHDSLSEALEAQGEHAEALSVSRRGLEVLASEDLPAARRDQLRQLLEQRAQRLGGR
jgi:hypothetical protein